MRRKKNKICDYYLQRALPAKSCVVRSCRALRGDMSSSYELRDRKEKIRAEEDAGSGSDEAPRKHRRTQALGSIEEQENEEPVGIADDTTTTGAKAKSISVAVSFGARAVSDNLGNLTFYACDSKGAKSPSQHVKGTIKA